MTIKTNEGIVKEAKETKLKTMKDNQIEEKKQGTWADNMVAPVDLDNVKRIMGMEETKVYAFLEGVVKSITDAQFYKYDTRQRGVVLGLLE